MSMSVMPLIPMIHMTVTSMQAVTTLMAVTIVPVMMVGKMMALEDAVI